MPALHAAARRRRVTALAIALRTRTFRSLRRHRNYRIFFAGQLVSLAGSWMQNVALAWLVLELSGSPLAVGALVFWRFVPFTVFGLVAGVVADRVDSRRLVMATQAAALLVSVALAVVTLTGTATLPIVYVLAALGGITLAFDAPGPPVAHLPDGRPALATERGRAERGPLQRLARDRPRDRRRRDRRRGHRRLLRRQRRSASSRCSPRSRACGRTSCTRSSATPPRGIVDGHAPRARLRPARPAAPLACSPS